MMNASTPPRFVPTLTEVVHETHLLELQKAASTSSAVAGQESRFEEQMVHRVLQRIDLVLERRLREAVGQLILAHTQALGPRLREEIEMVVRESVSQALAQELSQQASPD